MEIRDRKATQARIDAIEWYHEFDFGNGLKATTQSDTDSHRRIWKFIEANLDTVDFTGKSVLDIGSWDGYWSFNAERRGAKSVLATDDISQNWAAGSGIHLAKELLNSKIEINQQTSVYNLTSLNRKFDIIMYLGVYYHLHDPFYAFSQIRHCCHENTIVLIDGPVGVGMFAGGAKYNFYNHAVEFLPSHDGLEQLTDAAYFRNQSSRLLFGDLAALKSAQPAPPPSTSLPPVEPPGRLGWRWRLGLCWQALRGSRPGIQQKVDQVIPRVDPLRSDPLQASDRIFVTCRPFSGSNEIHVYPPPFGLHQYDERFRNAAKKVA